MKPDLRSVPAELPDPPYPRETKSNGWKPEFDVDVIYQSETWVLATDEEKPWLLRIWLESWRSVPAGSMPSDTTIFARRIGCTRQFLEAHHEIYLRGWIRHSDGRLYHRHISEQIVAMLEKRREKADRQRAYREKIQEKQRKQQECRSNVHVSSTQEQEQEQEYIPVSRNLHPVDSCVVDLKTESTNTTARSRCPYGKIRDLWCQIILPASVTAIEPTEPDQWTEARKTQIRARWRAELPDIETWSKFLQALTRSKFLMGKIPPSNGYQQFRLDLFWITRPSNYLKFIEGKFS